MKINLLRGKLKRMTAFVIVLIMLWSMLDTSMLTAYAKDGHNTYNMGIKTIGDGKTVISNTVKYDGKETLYKVENGVEVHISYLCGDCKHVYPNNTTRDGHSFTITDYKCEMTNDGNNLPSFVVTVTAAITSCKGKTYTNTFSAQSAPIECEKKIPTKTFSFTLATGDPNRLVVYLVSPNLPHTGNATCIAPAKCTRCNQQYMGDHNFDTSKWVNAPGENKHYHPCTQEGCTARSSVYNCYTYSSATCMKPAKCNNCFAILEEKNPNNHNNKLVYSSAENDNKITESCGLGCGHKSTATLQIKSDQNLVYTGEPITPMEMVYDSNWVGGQNQPDANCYSNNVEPGEATCTFTYGEATIVKTFTIEKGNYVVDDTIQNMTYDGEPHGITVDAPEGSTIKFMDQDGNYTLDESPKYSECGNYDISYQFSNSRYNTAEVTKTLIINQRPLVVTPDSGQSIIYGGDEPELTYSYSNVAGTEIPGFSGALSISGTDAGQHTITLGTLALKDNGDFKASNYSLELNSTPVSFEIGKASGKIAIPENQTVTYDGEKVTAGLLVGDVKYLYEGDGEALVKWYADNNGECGEALSEAPYNVGEYWVGVSATDGTNYNAVGEVVEKFSISPLAISDATVNVATIPNLTYTGEELKPEVVVSHNGKQLTLGVDYTVGYEDNVEAGQATVTISGMGNFNGETTANFTIEKADATITVDTTSYAKTFGDDDFNLGVTDSNQEADVIYTSSDEKVAAISGNGTVSIKGAGTATVTLSLAESDNYKEAASKEVEITVNKAESPVLADKFKAYTYAESRDSERVVITGLPEDCGAVSYSIESVTDEENMLENVAVDANGRITYDIKSIGTYKEGVSSIITVRAEMQNYEDAIYKFIISRTDKQVQEINAKDISLTYGDEGAVITVTGAKNSLSYEVIDDSDDKKDVVTVDENGKVSIKNAGTAKIRITSSASDSYAEAECEIQVTVKPASATITAKSYTVKMGDALPVFEYTVAGLVGADELPITVNVACKATDTSVAGNYDITVSGPEAEGNYTYTYKKGMLKIEESYPVSVSYQTHVQKHGWTGESTDGAVSGSTGQSKRLESIVLAVNTEADLDLQYTTHVQSYGWMPWVSGGAISGTIGEGKRLEAIMIRLTGKDAGNYDVYYRVHAQSYGWLAWASNGEVAGTAGLGKRLEGIQVVVVRKGEAVDKKLGGITSVNDKSFISATGDSPVYDGTTTDYSKPDIPGNDVPTVSYRTHVQTYGWMSYAYNGAMSGTTGKSKRLEGIQIDITNTKLKGDIIYTTHVQSYGWQANLGDKSTWSKNGAAAGTYGQAKRLEGICIDLTDELKEKYDVYYRVHIQSYGWLGWACNGQPAGSEGLAKRLEGIQIVLVPKGAAAPANSYGGITSVNGNAFVK